MTDPVSAQESFVTAGLALALMDAGEPFVPRDKFRFERAFEHAWNDVGLRGRFPAIAREPGVDVSIQVLTDHGGKRKFLPVAVFKKEPKGFRAALRRLDDTFEEAVDELVEDTEVTWTEWQRLGKTFLSRYSGG